MAEGIFDVSKASELDTPGRTQELRPLVLLKKEPGRLIAEASRLLKPGGRTVIVEWRAELDSPGPTRRKRISRELLVKLFEQAGITFREYREWSTLHYVALGEK